MATKWYLRHHRNEQKRRVNHAEMVRERNKYRSTKGFVVQIDGNTSYVIDKRDKNRSHGVTLITFTPTT